MLNKIKRYIILDCVIFTVMSVILGVFYSTFNTLSEDGAFYLNISMEHFAVATTISLLFFLINLIMEKIEGIKSHLIALCIVIGTVFIEGGWLFLVPHKLLLDTGHPDYYCNNIFGCIFYNVCQKHWRFKPY